jgi:hypothetical protein
MGTTPGIADISIDAANAIGTETSFNLALNVAKQGSLTVTVSGNGSVTKSLAGLTPQAVGALISIKATPGAGSVFAYWSDADTGAVLSTLPVYPFTMPNALDLQANFVVNPFVTSKGSYLALLQGNGYAESGFASMTLKATGKFSATFNLGGKEYHLKSSFNGLGQCTGDFTLPEGNAYSASLSVTAGGILSGTLTNENDGSQIPLAAERIAPRSDAALEGSYTVVLPAASGTDTPGGNGYGTLTVSKTGQVKFDGQAGDGVPVKFSGALDSKGVLPFLYVKAAGKSAGAELLLGSITFPPNASGPAGMLAWYRTADMADTVYPNGFSAAIPFVTGTYAPPPVNYPSAIVTFSGAGLPAPVVEPVTIVDGKATSTGPAPFTLSFAPKTGIFSGLFPDNGAPRPYSGAVLQSGSSGLGLFVNPAGEAGRVQLQATQQETGD